MAYKKGAGANLHHRTLRELVPANFKRCVNYFTFGNPDRRDNILNTVGIGKAVVDISVPSVVGMGLGPATTTLSTAGLGIQAFGDTSALATSQSPVAATTVSHGTVVNVLFGPFPELVVNGGFTTDLSGWTDLSISPSQVVWNSGQAYFRCLSADTYAGLLQQINISPTGLNKAFRVGANVGSWNAGAGNNARFIVGTITQPYKYLAHTISGPGAFDTILYPTELDIVIRVILEGNGSSFLLDNISLKRQDMM